MGELCCSAYWKNSISVELTGLPIELLETDTTINSPGKNINIITLQNGSIYKNVDYEK